MTQIVTQFDKKKLIRILPFLLHLDWLNQPSFVKLSL